MDCDYYFERYEEPLQDFEKRGYMIMALTGSLWSGVEYKRVEVEGEILVRKLLQ